MVYDNVVRPIFLKNSENESLKALSTLVVIEMKT